MRRRRRATRAEDHIVESTYETAAMLSRLPADLRRFYSTSDGFVTPSGISVYGMSVLMERNDTYEILEYCPGFLLIGDDSGGRGFLVALDSADTSIFSSGLGDLAVAGFVREAGPLTDWLSLHSELDSKNRSSRADSDQAGRGRPTDAS